MTELSLNEVKEIAFQILIHFKSFCEKNDIRYFLSNGTLLGAIKYRQFIPWDDDIDVFVVREDYEKLIRLYDDSKEYCLFARERNGDFCYPFAKLCDMRTRKKEVNINNRVELGVDIDIFPLDVFPNDISQAKKQVNEINSIIEQLNFAKLKFNSGKNIFCTVIKNVIILFNKIITAEKHLNKIERIVSCGDDNAEMVFCGCLVWPIYGEREIIPAEVFSDTIEVEFEGEKFPAPIGYDIYLRSLYGDYEQDPPLEKQKTHHLFKAYRIKTE